MGNNIVERIHSEDKGNGMRMRREREKFHCLVQLANMLINNAIYVPSTPPNSVCFPTVIKTGAVALVLSRMNLNDSGVWRCSAGINIHKTFTLHVMGRWS